MTPQFGPVGGFALTVNPDLRDAASACFTAGISILAKLQTMNPTVDGNEMLDVLFAELRSSFHDLSKPELNS